MTETFFDQPDDLVWLHDAHGVDIAGVACAILYGDEDAPDKIETFTVNDRRSIPTTLIACAWCYALTSDLALFPGGICLACYEQTPAARAPLSAEIVRGMWGIR